MTDRINVVVSSHPDIEKAVSGYADYIRAETLAESLAIGESQNGIELEWLDEKPIWVDATVV